MIANNYSAFSLTNLIRFLFLSVFLISLVLSFMFLTAQIKSTTIDTANRTDCSPLSDLYSAEILKKLNYNNTYPLTQPVKSKNWIRYHLGLISDEDSKSGSYSKNSWSAFYLKGYLTYYPATRRVDIEFDKKKYKVTNRISNAKRGLELSELIVFNGKLLACDDKTGIIYQLIENNEEEDKKLNLTNLLNSQNNSNTQYAINEYKLIPSMILSDGDGQRDEPFKCEWLAVKDNQLYVGSYGGKFQTYRKIKYNDWVKRINVNGRVEHLDWMDKFEKLKAALNLPKEGYVSHETAMWSQIKKKWFFLPRKVSNTTFNYLEDQSKGSNLMIQTSDDFNDIKFTTVGPFNEYHGVSSSKFLPNFGDEIIVALRTKEVNDSFSTYIIVFDLSGNVLYPETLVDDKLKFEGLEFV